MRTRKEIKDGEDGWAIIASLEEGGRTNYSNGSFKEYILNAQADSNN